MQAYQAGSTVTELAERHELNRQSVTACLRRAGVKLRPRRLPDAAAVERAIELYDLGWSMAKIGRDLGFDQKTIWRHIQSKVQTRTPWGYKQRGS